VLAAILWTEILFRLGAVSVDHFMGSLSKSKDTRPPIPEALEREFSTALAQAIRLAEARAGADRAGVEARYEVGAAYAIEASYRASIEGSVTASVGPARKAFGAQEDVLERQPQHAGANVIAGIYRYVVSGLRFPSRWLAYLVGFGGGRERGIAMIESAARERSAIFDALPALLLIYTREERYEDALEVAGRLAQAFPRNRLFALERGAAAIRARRFAEADAMLTRGLAALAGDSRPKAPGERALWFYKRGTARLALSRTAEAAVDFETALASAPLEWMRGRIHLQRGKLADLAGRRADARAAYRLARQIAETNDDPAARRAAGALLDRPFRLEDLLNGTGGGTSAEPGNRTERMGRPVD
jgi:tetratricopeptide (TPR) repeat protein